jgi:hypothetical protein
MRSNPTHTKAEPRNRQAFDCYQSVYSHYDRLPSRTPPCIIATSPSSRVTQIILKLVALVVGSFDLNVVTIAALKRLPTTLFGAYADARLAHGFPPRFCQRFVRHTVLELRYLANLRNVAQ